jgi:acetate kinase
MEKFAYMARKAVGAFAAAMGGLDCLVFTAGIGENSPVMRRMICEDLDFLGVTVDETRNEQAVGGGEEVEIGREGAATAVLVIPTNEEKMIALDTMRIAEL